ncbi:HNH endonuclease [Sphingobium sp. B8D3B]|nr:HNH endonuclease signature motif containing protein [Sphingobium sp. B8D3B]MCW2395876.1 5-methylcytosine-specific restriction protein A [Sphingobium sp. B8D3B]MCW2419392.1 5-methylcytosine-specific restriction protein A [Sphingobium sp. B8D3C]
MKIIARIRDRDPLCVICKAKGLIARTEIIDHIVSLADGGTDDDDNLQGVCKDCSDQKTEEEAARAQGRTPGALIKGKGTGRNGRPTSPDHPWNRRA